MRFVPLDLIVFWAWVPPYHRIAASDIEFRSFVWQAADFLVNFRASCQLRPHGQAHRLLPAVTEHYTSRLATGE